MKAGDVLFTGATVTAEFARLYERLSADIEAKREAGMVVEALLNGRHNLFVAYARKDGEP